MTMEAGEIAGIVVVVIVVLVGSVFLCFRCWKAIGEVVEDDQKPKRQTFMGSVKDGLRRSFRSSVRRMGNLRNSFRRSGGRGSRGRGKVSVNDAAIASGRRPATSISTIQALGAETSQIHPMYLKQSIKNETAGSVPRGGARGAHESAPGHCDDPTAGFGGTIKTAPSLSDGLDQQPISYPNPLYNNSSSREPTPDRAKASGMAKVKSHRSGYKQMDEDPELQPQHGPYDHRYIVGQDHNQHHAGYDQHHTGYSNATYQGDSPVKHKPRYDVPFEEGQQRGPQDVPATSGLQNVAVYDLRQESVSFPEADAGDVNLEVEARNVNAESTYI